MELEEISKKLINKVFGKKEIDFRESRFWRTNFSIFPKGEDRYNFINIECLNPDKFEGVEHFQFRSRFFHPDKVTSLLEQTSQPLNLNDSIKYLKQLKPLLLNRS